MLARAARRGGARRHSTRSRRPRNNLSQALAALSARGRELTQGTTLRIGEIDEPPDDSGALGTEIAPDALTVTIGFGHSLFDGRYGLTGRPS